MVYNTVFSSVVSPLLFLCDLTVLFYASEVQTDYQECILCELTQSVIPYMQCVSGAVAMKK